MKAKFFKPELNRSSGAMHTRLQSALEASISDLTCALAAGMSDKSGWVTFRRCHINFRKYLFTIGSTVQQCCLQGTSAGRRRGAVGSRVLGKGPGPMGASRPRQAGVTQYTSYQIKAE